MATASNRHNAATEVVRLLNDLLDSEAGHAFGSLDIFDESGEFAVAVALNLENHRFEVDYLAPSFETKVLEVEGDDQE